MFFIFEKLFRKDLEQIKQQCLNHGVMKERERQDFTRRQYQDEEITRFDGKFVIAVSNEYDNLSIGKASIVRICASNQPIVCLKDYISGEEVFTMGKVFLFNNQRFEALAKLNPNERCSIIYGTYGDSEFNKTSDALIYNLEEYKFLLTQSGFYRDYEIFLKKQKREQDE